MIQLSILVQHVWGIFFVASISPHILQGDQLNMAMLFWYLVKRDLFNVDYYKVASLFTLYNENTAMVRGHPVLFCMKGFLPIYLISKD